MKILSKKFLNNLENELLNFSQILFYENIASTNDIALSLSDSYPQGRIFVLAKTQTKGKGRLGRSWFSPKGGIYLSCLLNKQDLPKNFGLLSIAAAVFVIEALAKLNIKAFIKWPNDIVVKGDKVLDYFAEYQKIGGILCETKVNFNEVHLALGIGLNVRFEPHIRKKILHAAFLEEIAPVKLQEVILAILSNLDKNLVNVASKQNSIIRRFSDYCITLRRKVSFMQDGKLSSGFAKSVDEYGALCISCGSKEYKINSGEVSLLDINK